VRHLRSVWLAPVLLALASACAGDEEAPTASPTATEAAPPATATVTPVTPTATPTAQVFEPPPARVFTLRIGQTITVEDGWPIRFDAILEDSRCPIDVQCIWAGQVRVALTVQREGTFVLIEAVMPGGSPTQAIVDGRSLLLRSIDPKPVSTRQIEQSEYRLTLAFLP
jgi:hypothetical protein